MIWRCDKHDKALDDWGDCQPCLNTGNYSVVAADRSGNDWTLFRTDDRGLAHRIADAHRVSPYGYQYAVWDEDRDRWDEEPEGESCE